ncbi:hypothetical protein [Amycolatopsis sp. H20-H5]|uniref:hypothetical protein n=1 Tax=Amycolatopsis sp. H20-H5 TaxID=3046309 RepID=UPI002DB9CF84|nr:hypothetical protein [Amycolatopsis sp. H20-H5]MEC3982655.1 hypothetical protein [Amycolatopsis sp. H20-H5]
MARTRGADELAEFLRAARERVDPALVTASTTLPHGARSADCTATSSPGPPA